MKDQILVDTNVIVQYLKTGKGLLPTVYERFEMQISAVSLTELLASKTFEDVDLLKEVLEFVDKYFTIKEVSREIASKAAELVRQQELSIATSYVAATAIVNNMPLLSETPDRYKNVDELKLHKED